MKNMKKFISLLMVVAMLLAICAGCGATEKAPAAAPKEEKPAGSC